MFYRICKHQGPLAIFYFRMQHISPEYLLEEANTEYTISNKLAAPKAKAKLQVGISSFCTLKLYSATTSSYVTPPPTTIPIEISTTSEPSSPYKQHQLPLSYVQKKEMSNHLHPKFLKSQKEYTNHRRDQKTCFRLLVITKVPTAAGVNIRCIQYRLGNNNNNNNNNFFPMNNSIMLLCKLNR